MMPKTGGRVNKIRPPQTRDGKVSGIMRPMSCCEEPGKPGLRPYAELLSLYFALPAFLTLVRLRFRAFPVIPVLWLAMIPLAA